MTRNLSDFIGNWTILRSIRAVGQPAATFEGQGEWIAVVTGADYVERGVLHLSGQPPMTAERRYRWDKDLNIYFDDGRFFHQVPALGGAAAHWCDPDQYDVTYDFENWPAWSCTWKVKGPRKDYVLHSDYSKA
jgi:hypothetical protein